jgi:hypothetical protein
MRFITSTLLAMVILGVTAFAQRPNSRVIPSIPPPRDPPPHFTITPRGGALPRIGLPLPHIGLGPFPKPVKPGRYRRDRPFYYWPAVFYWPEPYVPVEPADAPAPPIQQPPAPGRLILDVQPTSAEVFAGGYYIGVPGDFSAERGGGILDAGLHRIDISAPGYESATVHLRLSAGQSITYRGALKALPPPATVEPTTFYLIPGCYMGNIPPKDAHLPATCDQSRAISWRP